MAVTAARELGERSRLRRQGGLRRRASPGRPTRGKPGEQIAAWAFLTPGVVLIMLFGVVPVVWSAIMSFQRNNLFSPNTPFVGLTNYRQMLHDPIVGQAIEHTVVYTALFVPGTMLVGLFLAVAMNRPLKFISVYRTAAYATMAISTISEALVFIWLFDPSYGIVNYLFSLVGIPQQQFLSSPSEALYVIVIMTIWGWTGFAVVIYLAALQGVPQVLTEAAAIDGAGRWVTFRRITLPLLSPASLFLVVWLTINALQLFDEVYLSTGGGPLSSTTVLVYYLYQQAFGGANFNFGYASAIAYFLFVIIIVVTAIQFRIGRRLVHYRS